MTSVTATAFRKDMFHLLSDAAKYNDELLVSTKDGNVVLLSEQEYRNLVETLYLVSQPATKEEILEGLQCEEGDCLSEDEVRW